MDVEDMMEHVARANADARNPRVCIVEYTKNPGGDPSLYRVGVYEYVWTPGSEHDDRPYSYPKGFSLMCYDLNGEHPRQFRVDKVDGMVVLDETWTPQYPVHQEVTLRKRGALRSSNA
jgi:hypothetical protein